MKRREFIGFTIGTGTAALALPRLVPASTAKRKQILILGGTNFLGPALVERALARGHKVTLFNRGITRPELFPNVEKLRGLRSVTGSNLSALAGRRKWDAVIDVWPKESKLVDETSRLLATRAGYYFFVSSIAVYNSFSKPGMTESAKTVEEKGAYGGEKALAEKVLEKNFPGKSGVCRCHAIVGPRDDGTAYHYWLRRLALEKEVVVPASGNDTVQYTDVRDVAAWIIDSVEQKRPGIHNICGPKKPVKFREFIERTRAGIGSNAKLVWVDPDFLRKDMKVGSFLEVPLWAPLDEDAGFYQIDTSKSVDAGVRFRSIEDTANDSWRWFQSHYFRDTTFPWKGFGMSREKEKKILEAWKAKRT